MSKVKWGGIVLIVVAIAVIVLLGSNAFRSGGKSITNEGAVSGSGGQQTTGNDGTASGSSQQAAGNGEQGDASGTAGESAGNSAGKGDGQSGTELQKEAESYVQQLAEPSDLPLEVHHAEGFVTSEQTLASSTAATGEEPAAEPIENRAASAEERSAQPQPAEIPAAEEPLETGTSGSQTGSSGSRTGSGLGASSTQADASGSDDGASSRTTVNLPLNEEAPVTIADIVGSGPGVQPDAVYYVHTVRDADVQGIWGIVQQGVVENFAQGVAVRRGSSMNTYRVEIPRNADELRQDQSSSFLGRLIYEKSRESYVYNFETGRIGQNPDFITPGQEIVIVSFTPEELIEIYKHFAQSGEVQG